MNLRLAILALTLPLLSGGCAAALLPLAAAGAMATQKNGGEKEARPMTAGTAIPPAARQSEAAELTRGKAVALAELGGSPGSDTYKVLELTELPAPSGASEGAAPAAYKSYSGFTNYVMDQTQVDLSEGSRTSAILKDPARLNGEVQECYGQPAAVLIDIDPPGDIFDTTARAFIDPGLREALRELSANSVAVLWISDLSPNFSGEVVTAINRAGFAEVTEDSLLLGAGEDGRKQALREQAAMRFCIVAIAGDEKGDFDEAYFYLRDPGAAIGLDRLYNRGWFLAPTPFITKSIEP